jgi:O-antigen ligase
MYSSRETRDRYFPGSKLHNAHSIWFETLGEHGFIGLFLFVAIGASALLTCGRVRKRTRDDPSLTWAYDLASMLQVSIIGFAVGGTFLNQASFDYYWQLAALAVCVSVAVRKAQSEATAQRSKVSGRPLYRPQGSGSPA